MTSPLLPAAIVELFDQRMNAAGRAPLKQAQAAMSAIYRDGGHSRNAVPDTSAALAYGVARMPATYAACVRAFDLTAAEVPDFAPRSVLDLGAGPGTATLAAAAVWPTLEMAHLIEPNAALAAMASMAIPAASALSWTIDAGDLTEPGGVDAAADLVAMSYVLAEHPTEKIAEMIGSIIEVARGAIIIVEPGTPAGFARILAARDALSRGGLHILAPCPHSRGCPLMGNDWCHFSVRLQRSAGHRHLKDADVSFEDERFSFVAATRVPTTRRTGARLIRPAVIEKGFVDLALCADQGLERRRVPRRDKPAYKRAKALTWGDSVEPVSDITSTQAASVREHGSRP